MRLLPGAGRVDAIRAHLRAWHRTAGRVLPGTRLHLLLEAEDGSGALTALHLFETPAAYQRAAGAEQHRAWLTSLEELLQAPLAISEVSVAWNAATDARPRVSVSIDRDVHATVLDLIGRLIARHPRTPAEELYLNMLRSIADDYEREHPATMPEEGDPR
jgi:hypothetical protein